MTTSVPSSQAVGHRYDLDGGLVKLIYPNGEAVDYALHKAGRLNVMTDWANRQTTYKYELDGLPKSTEYGFNGTKTVYGYDTTRRLTSVQNLKGASTISSHAYLLDAVGNRTQLTDTVVPEGTFGTEPNDPNTPNPLPTVNRTQAVTSTPGPLPSDGRSDVGTTPPNPTIPQRPALGGSYNQTVSYTYDKLYQLKDVAVAGGSTTSYTYDKVGNRATKSTGGFSYSYDKSDRVTGVTQGGVTTGYTFDNNGNLTNRGGLGAGGETYAYDRANRLISATIGTTAATTYAYDPDGKRISATVSGQVTNYLYDVHRGLPVLLEDGTRRYVWGQGLAYAVSGSGATLEVDVYHPDGLGSVRAQTDSSGAIVQTYQTDEFGNPTLSDGTRSQPFGFTGEQRDSATGLIYLRARMYDPMVGRFVQRDPVRGYRSNPLTLNRFAYVLNNPCSRSDPSGLDSSSRATRCGQEPEVPPLPPGLDLVANIHETYRHVPDAIWFLTQVRTGGGWDFKGPNGKYEAGGNFHFGVMAAAFGFPWWVAQNGAGVQQGVDDAVRLGRAVSNGQMPPRGGSGTPFFIPPYGDEWDHLFNIAQGYLWYAWWRCTQIMGPPQSPFLPFPEVAE
ncbi:MAG: RHS repeat-associated core domain-containing protein [Chloroflexota bacterium]